MAKKKPKDEAPPPERPGDGAIARNKRARFDFELGDRLEAGIELVGSEVKSLRLGAGAIAEAFVRLERGQAWLHGMSIPELPGAPWGHAAKRPRRLLLHRHQIEALARAIEREGMTCVAVLLYFRGGRAKLEIALARGKKHVDKRETVKRREADREAAAAVATRGRW